MKNILVLTAIIVLGLTTQAQQIISGKLHADKNMIINVKQFAQFISRFNYEEDFNGNPISKQFSEKFDRYNYISFLFNAKDKRLKDSGYLSQIERFVNLVVKDSLRINRLSDKIYALAKCKVVFNTIQQDLYLVLLIEKVNKGYRWALYDAYAKFIRDDDTLTAITGSIYDPLKLIPPTSNEVNFSHLRNVFQDKINLSHYVSRHGFGKGLNFLINLLQTNEIEFNYVEDLKYYIFDIKGWVLEVNEFIRDDENSGWLISDLDTCNGNARFYMTNVIDNLKNDEKRGKPN